MRIVFQKLYVYFVVNVILRIGEIIFGVRLSKNVKLYSDLLKKSESEILDYQTSQLLKILRNASEKSPFYKSIQIADGANVQDVIKDFPIMDKSTLKREYLSILTTSSTKLIKNSTSGSSGIQTEVFVTKEEQSKYRACQVIWWEWAGFEIGKPILQTGLSPRRTFEKLLKDFFFRTYYLFAFGLTTENVKRAFSWSRAKSPVLGGYASSLYVLSQIAEKENLKVAFKSVISWGDKMFDHYRANIERVFKCKVYETYGASEGLMMAAQKDLAFMYIMLPCVYIEILDEEGNEVPDGQIGNVVVTSLIHEAMPLIRYRLGDLAIKLPKTEYPDFREINLPLLQKVIGRETDIVKTKSGKKLIVHSFTGVFEYYPSIKQFCVVQRDLGGVEIQYIRDDNFKVEVIESINLRLRELVREDFEFRFVEVDFIQPTKSGKPQIIISELK